MLNFSRKYFQILCFFLTFHIVALNTCEKIYLNLLTKSELPIDIDIEEDTDSKTRFNESDSLIDEYLVEDLSLLWNHSTSYFTENISNSCYDFSVNCLLKGTCEIDTPPPKL